jgi:hypothetical protein
LRLLKDEEILFYGWSFYLFLYLIFHKRDSRGLFCFFESECWNNNWRKEAEIVAAR